MLNLKEIKSRHFYYNDLYYDFIFNFKKVKNNYFYDYANNSQFKKRHSDISSGYDGKIRGTISEILKEINLKYNCSSKTLNNIESLKQNDTLIAVGGQQPGFFSGPLFIIYKIISVIKLSQYLTEYLKTKVVPVFWNATDDSNFSAISSAYLSGYKENILKVEIREGDAGLLSGGKRYSDIFVDRGLIYSRIKELADIIQETEFSGEIEKFLTDCLKETGNTVRLTDYFSIIITKLFSEYGLVIIDPSEHALKKMALKLAYFDIENHDAIEKAIIGYGMLLKKEGYHNQLGVQRNAMNFYIVNDGIRHRVHRDDANTYSFGKNKVNEKELKDFLASNPYSLSLNVVLRPLFQDTILPVVSTICGPGEISYFAQLKGVYDIAAKKTAIIYPRFSATIIEKKIEKSFKKAKIDYESANPDIKVMMQEALIKIFNVNIDEAIKDFEKGVISKLEELKKSFEENDMQLLNSFNRIESNIKRESEILKKKIISEVSNKKISLANDINKILENVFPQGNLQERVFCIFAYINKYSFNFIEDIFKIIDIKNNSHKFIFFNDKDKT